MRAYSEAIVDSLQAQQEEVNCSGTSVVIKVNPEEPRPGYLDPNEYNIIQQRWQAREASVEVAPVEPLTPELALQAMRDSMGFPNRNLNTVEIHTRYERLHLEGNEVGLWRHYTRKSERKSGKPCLIFLHGGGWVGGSVYTLENPCRLIAELADAVVFNIDYSLAPEKKFPNGFNDCYNAVQHIYDHAEEYGIDRNKIAVGGDSAGANLTAAIAVKDRDEGTNKVALQILIYPCVTFFKEGARSNNQETNEFVIADEQRQTIDRILSTGSPSMDKEDEPILAMFGDLYFTDRGDAKSPYASPLLADSKGLPRALCVSAEFDRLRFQTESYGKKLSEAGVPVKTIRYKGCVHAFFDRLGFVPQAEDLCIEITNAIKAM